LPLLLPILKTNLNFNFMNQFFIKRAEYVEVLVPTANQQQKIYFPDLPNLRTSKTFGIEAYSVQTQEKTFTGNTVQALTELKNAMVSLYFDGGDFIQVPLLSIYRAQNSSTGNSNFYGEIPMLAGQVIVWAKSYIYLTDSANIANYAGKSFLFSVYYSKNNI
jgi:hypothetical protein